MAALLNRLFGGERKRQLTIYLHFPCFDGVASAVLESEVLRVSADLALNRLVPVTYGLRRKWLRTKLEKPCAIVDFLFHPEADYWVDHHSTTFLDDSTQSKFLDGSRGGRLLYDPGAKSCASVIWNACASFFVDCDRFKELVTWANKIDSASYDSVQEAILGESPALRINKSLTIEADARYCDFLVRNLWAKGLEQTAQHAEVLRRSKRAQKKFLRGLKIAGKAIQLIDDIAVLRLEEHSDATISRYSPYYFYPEARYSIACLQYREGTKITAMRNPWLSFESIPLDAVFGKFGGGGHQRVGSVFLPRGESANVESIVTALIEAMHQGPVSRESLPQGALV